MSTDIPELVITIPIADYNKYTTLASQFSELVKHNAELVHEHHKSRIEQLESEIAQLKAKVAELEGELADARTSMNVLADEKSRAEERGAREMAEALYKYDSYGSAVAGGPDAMIKLWREGREKK